MFFRSYLLWNRVFCIPATDDYPAVERCIDSFRVTQLLTSARLLLEVNTAELRQMPALLSVSIRSPEHSAAIQTAATLPSAVDLDIPPKSQMEEDPAVAHHVC